MEENNKFKSAVEYKKVADYFNMQKVNIRERVEIQLQNIYDNIETAARNGRYQTSSILGHEGQHREEIHNAVAEALQAKGFRVKLQCFELDGLIKVSWE